MTDATDGASCGKMRQHNDSSVEISINSHSQIATQPFDDTGDEVATQSFQQKIWGQLYPHSGTFPRIELVGDSFRLGRAQSNDYVVQKTDMVNEKLFLAISKTQCEVFRNSDGVFLKDYSSNGTWLNGEKIGKNMVRPLDHDSEICFAGANKKVFVFRSMDAQKEVFPEELTKNYLVSKELGKGACGIVRLGFRTKDLHRVAIKIINKKQTKTAHTSSAAIMNEVNILRKVKHPCIINLEDVIDTKDFMYIVLELAEGGELFEKIIQKHKFNEKEAKLHFYQLASAIQYLHASNICHRDLKPENVLLCSIDDSKPVIKVTDMGLSKLVNLGNELKTFCGTPNYLAPEIIVMTARGGSYDYKVDCWSLGVILYILLSGTPPFTDERQCDKKLREQILTANFIFYPQLFNSVSKEAKDLITKLLKVRPEERLSANEILEHPWLQDQDMRTEAHALMKEQEVKSQAFEREALRPLNPAVIQAIPVNPSVTGQLKRMHVSSENPSGQTPDKRLKTSESGDLENSEFVVDKQ